MMSFPLHDFCVSTNFIYSFVIGYLPTNFLEHFFMYPVPTRLNAVYINKYVCVALAKLCLLG